MNTLAGGHHVGPGHRARPGDRLARRGDEVRHRQSGRRLQAVADDPQQPKKEKKKPERPQ